MHDWMFEWELQVLNARSAISYIIISTLLTPKCYLINNNNKSRSLFLTWLSKYACQYLHTTKCLKLNFRMHVWTFKCELQVLNVRSAISYSINITLLKQNVILLIMNIKLDLLPDILIWMFKSALQVQRLTLKILNLNV